MIIKINKRMAGADGNFPIGSIVTVDKETGDILIAEGAELIEPEVEEVAPIEEKEKPAKKPVRKRGAK